ncbi:MAG: hypothetical protein HDR27_01440 [Lachnospiraceae bacterium]|nr:hypothetical protein [Lachnospiraceae bacterium]
MKLYSYVIPRDYGFAPNPFHGYCTLATCKPVIRRTAQIGDWIAAFDAKNQSISERLVCLMKVSETLTFDEYWIDKRFSSKRPVFDKSMTHKYGDNIYHHEDGAWVQEMSHHSLNDQINVKNLTTDTRTDRVLIAKEFYYFGEEAILLPTEYQPLIGHGRNHRVSNDSALIKSLIRYIRNQYSSGIQGLPFSRKQGEFKRYSG